MTEYRNRALHDAFLSYAKIALAFVSRSLDEGGEVPTLREPAWTDRENALIRQEGAKPLWIIVIHRLDKLLSGSVEYQECTRLLREDPTIAEQLNTLVGSTYMQITLTPEDILTRFITEILDIKGGSVFEENLVNERYSLIENALYSDEIITDALAPLLGLVLKADKIPLSEGFAIERLTLDEIVSCVRFGLVRTGPSENVIFNPPRYAVKVPLSDPKVIGPIDTSDKASKSFKRFDEAAERITEVVHALRLFKPGLCFLSGVVRRSTNWLMSGTVTAGGASLFHSPWFAEYRLENAELGGFKQFWDQLQSPEVKRRGFLDVAIKRFGYASERQLPEDQIIDLMIASEALFLCDLSEDQFRGELRFRNALRAGFFIGLTTNERREIFRLMKKAYDARSLIVHGGKPELPAGFGSFSEFVSKIQEYVRAALHKAIVLASNPSAPKYLVDWDELVFKKSLESDEKM